MNPRQLNVPLTSIEPTKTSCRIFLMNAPSRMIPLKWPANYCSQNMSIGPRTTAFINCVAQKNSQWNYAVSASLATKGIVIGLGYVSRGIVLQRGAHRESGEYQGL